MFNLYQINMRKLKPGQDPFVSIRLAIPDEYRQLLEETLEVAGITEHDKFFAEVGCAMHDYMEDKRSETITPTQIRTAHDEAIDAITEASNKLTAMYDLGKPVVEGIVRESSHIKCLEDMQDYLASMTEEIESLPQRLPKTFHERALANRIAIAMPADKPEQLSATIESVFEQVLAIVFEMVDSNADAHRMAIKVVQDVAPIWVHTRTNKATYRGKKRERI